MGRTPIAGISGVLGELISRPADPPPQAAAPDMPPHAAEGREGNSASCGTPKVRRRTRLGRPPGCRRGGGGPKEKVTLRIDAELISQYRDWSWEARCQLGELVERALHAYRSRQPR